MASRRDLYQSYQFMVQRVISGIVLRETDPIQTPLRKMSGSGFASVMVAVVGLAGAGLIGIFFPSGNTTWQDGGKVIVEQETGATFVWIPDSKDQMLLYPTVNFASAALLVGSTNVVEVSHTSLVDAPRGPMLGINDAPDSLPDPERMLEGSWTLCSLPVRTKAGARTPNTALVVGRDISEGKRIGGQAALVRDVALGTLHLIWNGHQYPINNELVVREALILQTTPVIDVGTAWLNALPIGRPLEPHPVAGRGGASIAITNGIVGQIRYVEAGGNTQYYQVDVAQILEITEVQALILKADPETRVAYGGAAAVALPLSSDEAARASRVELPDATPTDPPAEVPDPAEVTDQNPTICASFPDNDMTPEISVEAAVEGAEDANATPQQTESGTVLADRVLVRPGYGALVREQVSNGAPDGVLYLITDEGRRYTLPSPDAQRVLGYGAVTAIALPASLIARVPAGSALDPAAARQAIG